MYWKISLLFLITLVSCKPENRSTATEQLANEFGQSDYLIEVAQLQEVIGQENIKLLDFRKREFYDRGHIVGAQQIWRTDIEDASFPYDGMMASPTQIEELFSRLGIRNEDTIIIYDDNGLCDAARLWWVLQNYDFTNVKLLHGGINEWKENGGAISTEIPNVTRSIFQLTDNPSMKYYLSMEDMIEMIADSVAILDTRSLAEYSGAMQKKGAAKSGRIPNSIHLDWEKTIDNNQNKKFKSIEDLTTLYNQIGLKKKEPVVVYCHSGVRSAHTTFVLTQLLGFEKVKNYDGSWVEWSHFNEMSFEKDSLTTIIN